MSFGYMVPHSIARLARVLLTVEDARRAAGREAGVRDGEGVRVDHDADLAGLSLSCRDATADHQAESLDALSLCKVEHDPTAKPDELGAASLSLPEWPH